MPNIMRCGGGNVSSSIFGDGSDGDLIVTGTTMLPVPVAHQSIIEKHYKSLVINAGAILKCATYNAGLILRVKGDCTIHGTIDQSGMAPKTNPQNNYPYPSQLVCGHGGAGGNGGIGGKNSDDFAGGNYGVYMPARAYGGGYGGGGGGGGGGGDGGRYTGSPSGAYGTVGGNGGSSSGSLISVSENLFKGGSAGSVAGTPAQAGGDGQYGGGGGGGAWWHSGNYLGAVGGNGSGASGAVGTMCGGSGGGAGNYGGGVVLLYVGGALNIDGKIMCNGLNGGSGGNSSVYGGSGGGGGGGGGGGIYICYKGTYINAGLLQVNGGAGGSEGSLGSGGGSAGDSGGIGLVGSITVIQYTNGGLV